MSYTNLFLPMPQEMITSEIFTIEHNYDEPVLLRVANNVGQLLFEKALTTSQENISFGDWPAGIYFAIIGKGEKQTIKKVIKR